MLFIRGTRPLIVSHPPHESPGCAWDAWEAVLRWLRGRTRGILMIWGAHGSHFRTQIRWVRRGMSGTFVEREVSIGYK